MHIYSTINNTLRRNQLTVFSIRLQKIGPMPETSVRLENS